MQTHISSTWATRNLKMFTGADQRGNFSRLAAIFPARVVRRSDTPVPLAYATQVKLPDRYVFRGMTRSTAEFLTEVETVGLLVLKNGAIVHEWYESPEQATLQWPTWSCVKSIISCLIGIAITDGAIGSIHDSVSYYCPILAGSAYDGVSIEHVLQMCSGALWTENYADPESDVRRNARVSAGVGSRDELAATTQRVHLPGSRHRYNSNDTHVLGMVLRSATQRNVARLLREKIWAPLGMEDDAFFLVDSLGIEWAAAGLQVTLRDLAKFGLLYLNEGQAQGRSIVPAEWVHASTRAQVPHLTPGPKVLSPGPFGYGYQWWLAPENDGAYCAIGVYNQYVYVNPRHSIVIVKSSANRRFACSYDEAGYRDEEHLALFSAIAEQQ